jgi:hypothetical protein
LGAGVVERGEADLIDQAWALADSGRADENTTELVKPPPPSLSQPFGDRQGG